MDISSRLNGFPSFTQNRVLGDASSPVSSGLPTESINPVQQSNASNESTARLSHLSSAQVASTQQTQSITTAPDFTYQRLNPNQPVSAASTSLSEGSNENISQASLVSTRSESGAILNANSTDSQDKKESATQEKIEAQEEAELALIQKQITQLAARDREVRTHEQAHMAAGGQYAGAASYTYERGPDGVNYAVGGEVPIDVSPAATPAQTIEKAQVVKRAALAPAEPSPQDRKVASLASAMEQQARAELLQEQNASQSSKNTQADQGALKPSLEPSSEPSSEPSPESSIIRSQADAANEPANTSTTSVSGSIFDKSRANNSAITTLSAIQSNFSQSSQLSIIA